MAEKVIKNSAKNATVVKDAKDLQVELAAKRKELLEARQSLAAGELVNPLAIRGYRKDIARLLTELNVKESK